MHHSMSKNQKWTLASTFLGFMLENMDGSFVSFALSSIIATLSISKGAAGSIYTVTSFGVMIGGLVFGLLSDRFGRVKVFTNTIFIYAAATIAMFFAKNIYMIYLFRFFSGIGVGGEYGAGVTLIAEGFKPRVTGRLTSLTAIGGQIGSMIAALSAAAIIPVFGWHALFLIGLIPVIFAFIVRRNLHESNTYVDTMQKRADRPKVSVWKLFRSPAMAYQTLVLFVMVFIQTSGYYGLMNWLPTIMKKRLGLSVAKSSLWMICTIFGMILGMITFGTIMDKFGPRISFGVFLLISAIAVYGITFAFNAWSLLLATVVLGYFSDGMYGGYGAMISKLYPTEVRATANNCITSVGKFCGSFAPMIIGIMMDHYSLLLIMGCISVMYVISFIIMMSIPKLRHLERTYKVSD